MTTRARYRATSACAIPYVPTGFSAPLTAGEDVEAADLRIEVLDANGSVIATVDSGQIGLENIDGTLGGRDNVPLTNFTASKPGGVPSGDHQVRVTVTDKYGNTGSVTETLGF